MKNRYSYFKRLKFTLINQALLAFMFVLLFSNISFSQTKGMIFEPATGAGAAVLDPNGDGYVSATTAGFINNDRAESEIPYVPFIFPGTEPTSDINNGPNGGFTDFVDSGTEDPAMNYVDASNNWLFRLRMGSVRPNAKSYSILIDTDGKFGNSGANADPDYTSSNPGFEIEIVLATKFGVYVYNVDDPLPSCTPVLSYEVTTNYQKSIAHSEIYNPENYFLDFFVPFGDLTSQFGITSGTPIRMAIVDNMAALKSTVCNTSSASDIAGVDGSCGSLAACFETIIGNQEPCTLAEINAGLCLEKSACPLISGTLSNGATSVSGTSTEADGTIIKVYRNTILIGTESVFGGNWSLTGISPALASNDIINATAKATGEAVSEYDCNTSIVGATCSTPPTSASHIGKSISGYSSVAGAIIKVYLNDGSTPLNPNAGSLWTSGQIAANSTSTGVNGTDNFLWKCVGTGEDTNPNGNGAACLADGVYRITATEPGKCESTPIYLCIGTGSSTATPIIFTSPPITTASSSISGTIPSPDNIAGIAVQLFVNGVQAGSVNSTAGGDWIIGSLNLNSCDVVTVRAINAASTKCISHVSTGVSVSGGVSNVPEIRGAYCTLSPVTIISGNSSEADGTIINVYENGVLEGSTTVVSGAWSLSGGSTSISIGSTITADATASGSCKTVSPISSGVVVSGLSSNLNLTITTSPIIEQSTSISGTGNNNGDIITLYVDGFQVEGASATVSGGVWTISGLAAYEIYTGGVVTVKATSPGFCESAPSDGVTVECISPNASLVVNPDNEIICSGSFVANVQVVNSENLIIYQLYTWDGAFPRTSTNTVATGSSVLGNGSDIILTSGILTANTTLIIKALKIPPGACEVFLTETISVTVNASPDLSLAVSTTSPICSGTSTNVSVELSEAGFSYQLRNDANDDLIGGSINGTGGTIDLPTGNLTNDIIFNVLATGTAPSSCSGELTHKASITINGACMADLSLSKTVDNTTPTIGDIITFTLTLKNSGPSATTNVQVEDILPTGLSFESSITYVNALVDASITYNEVSGLWDLSSLTIEVNDEIKLEVSVKIDPGCGNIINSAQIIASDIADPDSIPNNNQ